jgi:hypothetical protein
MYFERRTPFFFWAFGRSGRRTDPAAASDTMVIVAHRSVNRPRVSGDLVA